KTAETRVQVDFELCSPFDIQSLQLPTRQITPVCTWCMRGWYRSGTGCDYNGTKYFTKDGTPTDDPSKDVCGGRRQDCQDRHGPDAPLPFGGFPAANLQGK
ncbi:TPA: phage minor tail protein L, partial [Escherichia coli]